MENIELDNRYESERTDLPLAPQHGGRIRVLLIDDDPIFCRIFSHWLRLEKIECDYCTSAQMVMQALEKGNPDVVFIDYNLDNQVDGASLCQWISTLSGAAIVAISADSREETALINLRAGALNYLTKPINFRLLPATIYSLARHARQTRKNEDTTRLYLDGRIQIDLHANLVKVGEQHHELSAKETAIICVLAASFGRTVPKSNLFEQVYRYEYDPTSRALDIAICRLRKKVFESSDFKINTLRSRGYRLDWAKRPTELSGSSELLPTQS